MQITTGIDIIEVDRIKSAVQELGDTFLNKIYTMSEISQRGILNINIWLLGLLQKKLFLKLYQKI